VGIRNFTGKRRYFGLKDNFSQKFFRSSVVEFLNQFRKDLGLIQFFTFTKEITQGWFIKKDSSIIDAAGMIHSDFALKFKVAETISLENFVKIKDWEV
jgi:ribosome-binding ATPase YchF (GTP1/OBG family)